VLSLVHKQEIYIVTTNEVQSTLLQTTLLTGYVKVISHSFSAAHVLLDDNKPAYCIVEEQG
jgi:hypothetical protein